MLPAGSGRHTTPRHGVRGRVPVGVRIRIDEGVHALPRRPLLDAGLDVDASLLWIGV